MARAPPTRTPTVKNDAQLAQQAESVGCKRGLGVTPFG